MANWPAACAALRVLSIFDSITSRSRAIPGDAANSYLVIKLEGTQSVGSRMPIGGSALDNIDLTNIKNWINNGAENN